PPTTSRDALAYRRAPGDRDPGGALRAPAVRCGARHAGGRARARPRLRLRAGGRAPPRGREGLLGDARDRGAPRWAGAVRRRARRDGRTGALGAVTVVDLLFRHAGARPAFTVAGAALDFGDLRDRVGAFARGLAARGVGAGDPVALVLPTSPALVALV